ncbi:MULTISPECIES: YbaL family putative K(+) efflux transporter [unclassified Methylophilus]|jgi:monovalent cation:H+ antiporter-2, CPA2 family|uniref:YbaL family putative K(+) efflux transporter n=1 Tax=unclassified Methylophilus TaxID=2630143 RepID=UPI0007004144|nr:MULTISPECIES: YbaL family putative K(+) efflux transporter [unclassified Methylophilus]KQT34048.1 sodium:proton antiporter [Methylophilus sp. Leaf414]KQT41716.1 sodium:proton antiporter [Methylophilus sp. Leaf416]KQT55883.1 sodium:proton antiporter [Methylophilus sp. Leaf459]
MDHNLSLITTIAAAFALSLIFGLIAEKLKLPALIGYLFAGILIGPATPGFVADIEIASQLSELGVMLLMFGVGLHFSIQDLMSVKRIALPGALVQMALATLLGMLVAHYWGWSVGHGLVFGLSLSCASTVVLLKALESRRILESMNGKIAVGWLVVEDMITVLVLVLMPALAGALGGQGEVANAGAIWETIGMTMLEIAGFVAVMLVVGRRVLPWLLWYVAGTGSRELFTLTVIAVAIGVAFFASSLFNVSFALGAFFAGMIMRESEYSHRAAEDSLPFRDAFAVLFFVAVGMLFDPSILIKQPYQVLAVVGIIVVGKSLAAVAIVLALRYPLNTALTVAASLAQIGEFSFILAGLGVSLGLLSQDAMSLVLAGALISIALNPLVFASIKPFANWVVNKSDVARRLSQRIDPYGELPMTTERKFLEGQVVLVGYGRVGKRIAMSLEASSIPFVVAEQNRELVEKLRKKGQPAVSGNAADPMVLIQAHIANAAMLIIATPDSMDIRKIVDIAKQLKPDIEVVIRTHHEDEYQRLQKEVGDTVFFGEEELAKGMSAHVLKRFERHVL